MKKLFRATIASLLAVAPSVAVAQQPPAAPVPKLPAMPSLEQKGSDDMTKPAGASSAKAAKPAPEPKHAAKDAKKHEPEPPAAKTQAAPPKGAPAKHEKAPAKSLPKAPAKPHKAEAPGAKRKAMARPMAANHDARAHKPTSGRTSKRRK